MARRDRDRPTTTAERPSRPPPSRPTEAPARPARPTQARPPDRPLSPVVAPDPHYRGPVRPSGSGQVTGHMGSTDNYGPYSTGRRDGRPIEPTRPPPPTPARPTPPVVSTPRPPVNTVTPGEAQRGKDGVRGSNNPAQVSAPVRRVTIAPVVIPARAKPDKKRTPDHPETKKPAARSSEPKRDARQEKTGSAKLTDKNFKGYDAIAGNPRKKDPLRCKERPKDNRPKGGGGGGPRRFVPWC